MYRQSQRKLVLYGIVSCMDFADGKWCSNRNWLKESRSIYIVNLNNLVLYDIDLCMDFADGKLLPDGNGLETVPRLCIINLSKAKYLWLIVSICYWIWYWFVYGLWFIVSICDWNLQTVRCSPIGMGWKEFHGCVSSISLKPLVLLCGCVNGLCSL